MKKLLIFTMIVLGNAMFALENEISMDDLKPISFENSIDVLFVEGNLTEISKTMETYENKDTFYYNYIMGKLCFEGGKKDEALRYFEKALTYEKNNVNLRMELLKIYLVDRAYKDEVEKNIAFLENSSLTEKEKVFLSELKELYIKSNQIKSTNILEIGLSYDDNRKFTKNKESQFYNTDTIIYIGVKDLKAGSLRIQNSLTSKVEVGKDGETGFSFNLGGDYFSQYKGLNYNIPFYMNFSSMNSNELRLITGLSHKKNIVENQDLNTGVEVAYIINNNFDGTDLSLYGNYKLKKSINYAFDARVTLGIYSDEMYEKNSFLLSANVDTVLKNKYYIFGKYTYEYVGSKYEVQGVSRKDAINTLKIGYEQGMFKENMKFGLNYTYSYDWTNFEGEESSKNLLNTSVKWEF